MRKIFEFSVRNSLFVNLLSLFILVAGIFSLFALRREAFPNISYDTVMVQTDYYGAPPEEVEKLVTMELEDELKEVSGIDEMTSISSENISLIIIKIDPDETDKSRIVNDIQRAVDKVDNLPLGSEDPEVDELRSRDFPVINVSLSGEMSELSLQKLARKLEIRLLDLRDVARIDRVGWRDREIWVEVDPERVREDRISLLDIMVALRDQNRNLPGGTLTTSRGDYLVRTIGEFETAEEVSQVIIRANDLGNWVRVSDVATVKDAFEEDDVIEKTFGTQAINLTVVKKEKGDIIRLVEQVKGAVSEFQKGAPEELKISYFDDYSYYVKRRLNVLKNNGAIGLTFVVLALLLFLTRSVAIMTAIGIPIALMAAFLVMQTMGLTINLITMFGLIMVLGLVVDDAIIVAENIYRHMERGLPPKQAAVEGASEVALPVLTTVLTTIVAFVPLFFMGGIIGKFIRAIPFVVIIALAASLFECFVIMPSHLADFAKVSTSGSKKKGGWFLAIQSGYLVVLRWVIGHRYKAISGFVLCFIGAIFLYVSMMRFVLFPQGLIEEFFIRGKAPIGTSLAETEIRMRHLENIVKTLPESELDNFVTQVGMVREDVRDPYAERGSHVAQIHVFLTPDKSNGRRKADEIIEDIRSQSSEYEDLFDEISFEKVRAGPPVGKPVSVRLRGDDFSMLEEAAEKMKAFLIGIPGLKDVKDDFDPGKKELRIEVDEEAATKAFLTITRIATTVRNAIDGGIATTIQKTDEEIDVIVRYPEDQTTSREIFDSIYIPNRLGNLVPLKKVATLKEIEGVNVVKHFDRKRMINVMADVDEKVITPLDVEKIVRTYYEENLAKQYPELILSFSGEQEETQKSLRDFVRALFLALFLIFIILAANFNSIVRPLIVMLAIPFGIVGVIVIFFLHGQPISFMALLGIIGLSGVVVNDSIVLVDFITSLRKKGMKEFESILEAGKLRLRPVILTTITTLVGLMPIAYGLGGSDPFLKPMALAISWGLVFATILTLLLIPCAYSVSDDVTHLLERFRKGESLESNPRESGDLLS